jgi:hypothetical protein
VKLTGLDPDTWLELEPAPEISTRSFSVTATTGRYRVENDSVALLGAASFLAALADFERTRHGEARLEGTYDFELLIAPHQGRGDALLRFRVVDPLFVPGDVPGSCRLESAMVVAAESVGAIAAGLQRLLAGIE